MPRAYLRIRKNLRRVRGEESWRQWRAGMDSGGWRSFRNHLIERNEQGECMIEQGRQRALVLRGQRRTNT